jgi:hypothetical protein
MSMAIYDSDMRTLINLPEDQVKELDELSRKRASSRTALVREAVAQYLQRHRSARIDDSFGLWKDAPLDGVEYQRRLRREWNE